MAAPAPLKFHGLQGPEEPNRGIYAHDGKPPRLLLKSGTSDKLREVELTRDQLLQIAEQALVALRQMDRKGL